MPRTPSQGSARRLAMLVALGITAATGASAAELRYAEDQAPGIVNPLFSTTMAEARVNELLFDALYTDNQELGTAPALVASERVSSDQMSMDITLRDDVIWHDGTTLTAADVVFTINAMKDEGTLSTEAGRVAWIDTATNTSSTSLTLTFTEPQLSPQDKLFFKILPAHMFQSSSVSRSDGFKTGPIGTGPYLLTRYNDDNSITFEANANYRNPVGIDKVVMREVSDKAYQAKLLIYESLEALVRVLPRDLSVLQNDRKVELYPYQTNSWWYVGFNVQNGHLGDPLVRKALAHMVDTEALLAPIGTGELVSGPFVTSSPFYNHDVAHYTANEGKAARLLTEAGYIQQGGQWSKDGKPLTLTITAHQTLESAQEVVINLQSQMRNMGVAVEVEFLDEAAWKARIWRERDFEMILSQWSFDRNEDVRDQLHSEGSRNFGGYSNPALDALLDEARSARDPLVKKQALRKVHKIAHDDAPMLFLWTMDSYSAMSTKVRNVVIHPFYFFTWSDTWSMRK